MIELSKEKIEKSEKEGLQNSLIAGKVNRFVNISSEKIPALFIPIYNPSFYRDFSNESREKREKSRKCSLELSFELNKKVFWISYGNEFKSFYQEEKTKLLFNQFFREADYSLIDKLCQENNYNSECLKKFDKTVLENLYKYIGFLLEVSENNNRAKANIFCQISDILIIADYSVYVPVKNYLSSLDNLIKIAGIIPTNLKNGFKLIIVSKQGLTLTYNNIKVYHDDVKNLGGYLSDCYSYLHVDYETQLLETNPAMAFKE